jgi:hypothetical protein
LDDLLWQMVDRLPRAVAAPRRAVACARAAVACPERWVARARMTIDRAWPEVAPASTDVYRRHVKVDQRRAKVGAAVPPPSARQPERLAARPLTALSCRSRRTALVRSRSDSELSHTMAALRTGDIIRIPDDDIGESVVDEMFDAENAERMKRTHPVGRRCDRMVARDPGDNLIVIREGAYHYWDHETDRMIRLGSDPEEFATVNEV